MKMKQLIASGAYRWLKLGTTALRPSSRGSEI
jgi:hypothetical protein